MLRKDLNIYTSCEVSPLVHKNGNYWPVFDVNGLLLGEFDWVISTAPAPQTLTLFNRHIEYYHPLRYANMYGCYALMLGFNKPWDRNWIAAKVRNNPIKWISVNSTKPGRAQDVTCLVVHSRNDLAQSHIEKDTEQVKMLLLEQFSQITNIDATNADYVSLHRWSFAIIAKSAKQGFYLDKNLCLAATSDWCETSRIEEVWLHAQRLARYFNNIIK